MASINAHGSKNRDKPAGSEMSDDRRLYDVGSVVRAPLPNHHRVRRRAIIATVQEEDGTACLIWEDDVPRPLDPASSRGVVVGDDKTEHDQRRHAVHTSSVLAAVGPRIMSREENMDTDAYEDEAIEATVPLSEISPLLDFELEHSNDNTGEALSRPSSHSVGTWKDRGDALLRLGDASAAVPYYEKALDISSALSVGGTVIVKDNKGRLALAEVDCVDESSGTVDVSLVGSGEEVTLKTSDILLCLLEPDDTDRFQERIVLNVARCLVQLAETTTCPSRRPDYLRGAVWAATFAMTVTTYHDKGFSYAATTEKTALLIRSRAQASMSRFPRAIIDLQRLLVLDPHNKEGKQLLAKVERRKLQQQMTDKKLVKDVCRWVNKATDDADDSGRSVSVNRRNDNVLHQARPSTIKTKCPQSVSHSCDYIFWLWFFVAGLVGALAWLFGSHL